MPENSVDALGALIRQMRSVDLAPKLERGIPKFPTHPHMVIDPTVVHRRDGYYCQSISMAEHTGCHCDAPAHIHADRMHETIETFPADCLISTARVYDFSGRDWQPGEMLTRADILDFETEHGAPAGPGDIALVNFGWLKRYWHVDERAHFYAKNQPGMDEGVASLFRERGVRAVGADTIACEIATVDGVLGDDPGHGRHWLPHGILILECVARMELLPRSCFLFAAPLPIENGSGSPLRPVAFF
ncbi:cyclase family protein [Labrys wisconsinensis]|uniref:Kynurenine formamidase n=1 Tax=Labrys wisconsinensis TaxID=425677 RepID=A0ABU0J7T8_9HYPH|nr:cyclase family protein [Labrys wisconsinensis]MDQ0469262.1 kynurenine formamidase [Labrys wisconsinensis]